MTTRKTTRKAPAKSGRAAMPRKTANSPPKPAKSAPPANAGTDAALEAASALDNAVAATLDPTILPPPLQPELKKRELIDKVVRRTGVKKKDAKPVIEAALELLGEALSDGRELNIKPFGKMKVQRVKQTANGQVLVTKVRQPDHKPEEGPDPLAQAAE